MNYRNIVFSFNKIGSALASETRLQNLFDLIVGEIIRFTSCDRCSLFIRESDPDRLMLRASQTTFPVKGKNAGQAGSFTPFPVNLDMQSIVGYTALTGEVVNIGDCHTIPETTCYRYNNHHDKEGDSRTVSMLSVPMKYKDGSVIGVIALTNKRDDDKNIIAFVEEMESVILAIAGQAAAAIKNAQLHMIQKESGFIFSSLLLALCGYSFFLAALKTSRSGFSGLSVNEWTTVVFALLFIFIAILTIKKTGLPMKFFGLTLENTKVSLIESGVATLAVVALITAFKFWAVQHWDIFKGAKIVDMSVIGLSYFTYILIAPIQEFIGRGVLQNSLERSLSGSSHSTFWAVVVSSCVFGAFHIFYSVSLALATVVSGFLWGYLFTRHHNIIGIGLSHFIVGNYIALAGFWELLISI